MRRHIGLAALWAALWGAAICLPSAFLAPPQGGMLPGLALLVTGWAGYSVGQFAWFANLPFLVALGLILGRSTSTLFNSIVAGLIIGLASDAWLWRAFYGEVSPTLIVKAFGPGFYSWIAAMYGAALTLAWLTWRARGSSSD
jgi:hypothetical protein